jgi:uncharacterized protein (DUF58 family)
MATHASIPGARFVDPCVLARIGKLDLLARTVVDGFINGLHRAPFFGASIDFAEHRGYVPGDDIRRIDWKVFARTDRFYIKQYDADTNTNFSVLLDVSKSMSFGSGPLTKLEYGSFLAACLGYMSQGQRDRVGIITFDSEIVSHVPPSAKHFNAMLQTLDRARPGRKGDFVPPVSKAAEFFKRRGFVAIISDLYEDPDRIVEAVKPLSHLGNDLLVFHVLDKAELQFDYDDASRFRDLESDEELPVVPESFRKEYRKLVDAHIEALRSRFSESRIDYSVVDTSRPLDEALFRYLAARQKMSRTR